MQYKPDVARLSTLLSPTLHQVLMMFFALVVHPLHYLLNEVLVLGACDVIIQPAV